MYAISYNRVSILKLTCRSNPERLQQMMQMASTLRQAGFPLSNPYGGPGAMAMPPLPFPAPGVPSPNPPQTQQNPSTPSTTAGSTAAGTTPNVDTSANQGGAGTRPPGAGASGSPFGMIDPALMQQLMAMGPFGAGGLGAGGLGAYGGSGAGGGFGAFGGSPTPPADTRTPEERFQVQLQVSPMFTNCVGADQQPQQLRDMGFTNASQNIRALLATGGNVQSAIEYILDGGGL